MASIVRNVVHWGSQQRAQLPAQNDMCEICGKKPKFVEKGHKHPYCSRTCARNGQATNAVKTCLLKGCKIPGKAPFTGFCSDAHAKEAVAIGQVEGCESCQIQPRSIRSLCVNCDRSSRGGPHLRQVNSSESKFHLVRKQFITEWSTVRNESLPSVDKIYEVIGPRDAHVRYAAYRRSLRAPREIRTFHASQCICDLGTKTPVLCDHKSCGICSIVKSSFKTFAFGESYNSGRFGHGIYSYKDPRLADEHATSCTSSPYRVLIACDVLVENDTEIAGDASVFVETPDSISPAYVVMYSK